MCEVEVRWRDYWREVLCDHGSDGACGDNECFQVTWANLGSYVYTECVYSLYDCHCKQQLSLSAAV